MYKLPEVFVPGVGWVKPAYKTYILKDIIRKHLHEVGEHIKGCDTIPLYQFSPESTVGMCVWTFLLCFSHS